MNRRHLFLRLLLCCMLLGAQQMGWSHALSHLRLSAGNAAGAAVGAAELSRGDTGRRQLPQADQVCEQCLAFAQIDAVVGSAAWATPTDRSPDAALSTPVQSGRLPTTACFFHPRGPPAS